ncbi:MAG: VanZ family protein [Candidatus Nanopelagicales bacterium]
MSLATSLLLADNTGSGLWGLHPCPYRVAEVDDLITNSFGALIGWSIGILISRLMPYHDRQPRTDLAPPSIRRRLFAAALDVTMVVISLIIVDVLVLLVKASQGREVTADDSLMRAIPWAIGLLVFLVVPLLRSDRATLGQAALSLGEAEATSERPASRRSVSVHYLMRWTPVLIIGTPAIVVLAGRTWRNRASSTVTQKAFSHHNGTRSGVNRFTPSSQSVHRDSACRADPKRARVLGDRRSWPRGLRTVARLGTTRVVSLTSCTFSSPKMARVLGRRRSWPRG